MNIEQLLKSIRNTAVKLDQTYEKFSKQGITLDIFDDIYPELERAIEE